MSRFVCPFRIHNGDSCTKKQMPNFAERLKLVRRYNSFPDVYDTVIAVRKNRPTKHIKLIYCNLSDEAENLWKEISFLTKALIPPIASSWVSSISESLFKYDQQ